jgi:hypothetical protein
MSMKKRLMYIGVLLALIIGLVPLASVSAASTTLQMAIVIDGSGANSTAEFQGIIDGLAEVVAPGGCFPKDGSFELTVVQYGDTAETEVGPVVLTADNAEATAEMIEAIAKVGGDAMMDAGIDEAVEQITTSANFSSSTVQVINVVATGPATDEDAAVLARDEAAMAGIDELDSETVSITPADAAWFRDELVFAQPGEIYGKGYADWPPAPGVSGWVLVLEDTTTFAQVLCVKLGLFLYEETTTPPGEPEEPECPECPCCPECPDWPDCPECPDWPDWPDCPDLPDCPCCPDWPEWPELPDCPFGGCGLPEWPELPDCPFGGCGMPEWPHMPEWPGCGPSLPEWPELPDCPFGGCGMPGLPEWPDHPDMPDLPDMPDHPDWPSLPDLPGCGDWDIGCGDHSFDFGGLFGGSHSSSGGWLSKLGSWK